MNPNLRNSVDEVSNMAEELGLSTLLGLTSPEGKSPSKSSSPQKVTKEVIYKKFEKQWDKANYGVLKDRYESKPHKPPVLDKRDLARLADPIRGKYRSQKEYIERVTGGDPDELAELETSGAFLTDIDLGGNENRPQNNMMSSMDMSRGGGGTFLTENMDGSVSPVKQRGNRNNSNPTDTTRRSVQYNRSGGNVNNQQQQQQQQQANKGVGGRNGAVSRLRGKLEEASRMDYKRGTGTGRGGLQNSVLSGRAGATNNNSANARGRGGAMGTAGPSRFGGGSTSVRSVRSSGYGLPAQNKTTGGIGRAGAGARGNSSRGNTSMNRSMNNGNGNGSSSRASSVRPRRGGRDEEDLDKSKDQGQPRGRVYVFCSMLFLLFSPVCDVSLSLSLDLLVPACIL
jgi:hypothetical protein